ncbi:bifunctional demethylmenaquinone methyltransferase/2-methoxy-6-polyprenyl-1,4-benzoquinol methylase UbiE [Pajaroellobacter abortibovis]|uniref:Demethylmenaquinone methyltransferase n=1 Tax=Pajaroellobacter abortibovis TaxID=1882918 RepID=A0A1L6MWZ6_9BACT|nr:bifunctional demethylmenaquinone methyltransferase/2-methoxy-6-polyprenyl-1,4-benzoquinol methylase UbiE [Pajaroellobacter abortibovis]APR99937.1 ubiquinone biosynthesis methyltransferase UbiE [Pajaroellobacter abortibovis]
MERDRRLEQSAAKVREGSGKMFDGIAQRYDLLNRVLSLGMDRGWRRRVAMELQLPSEARVLDLATGTSDLAIEILCQFPHVTVEGVDPSHQMLAIGREKLESLGLNERVRLSYGQAEKLAFQDASFDAVVIAFGIRNVQDRKGALREMARVTKPGGQVAILELSEPQRGWMSSLARFYIHTLVPWVGAALSGTREYRYLAKSIASFPPSDRLIEMMEESQLQCVKKIPFLFGVVMLYIARSRWE